MIKLEGYKILKKLGSGGMGKGYITRFKEGGLFYLFPSYEETDLLSF